MSSLSLATSREEIRGVIARRITFGVGSLGTGTFTVVPSILLLYYLTTYVHVQPAFAGLVVLTPKIVSIFTDPVIGHLSDRLKAKSELHRRCFMLVGAFAAGFGLWSVFTPSHPCSLWRMACGDLILLRRLRLFLLRCPPMRRFPLTLKNRLLSAPWTCLDPHGLRLCRRPGRRSRRANHRRVGWLFYYGPVVRFVRRCRDYRLYNDVHPQPPRRNELCNDRKRCLWPDCQTNATCVFSPDLFFL